MMADSELAPPAVPPDGSSPAAPAAPPEPPTDEMSLLAKTHPASIAILTWRVASSMVLPLLGLIAFGGLGGGEGRLATLGIAGVILIGGVVGGGAAWLAWSRFRYGVIGRDLVIRSGVIVRHRKAIPVARIQGIDIKATLLMRVLGLVEVTVQTAGGGADEPEAKITGIPMAEAERLRAALLHDRRIAADAGGSAAGADAEGGLAGPGVGLEPLSRMGDLRGVLAGAEVDRREPSFQFKLPPGRLILSGITSNKVGFIFLGIVGVLGQGIEILDDDAIAGAFDRASALAIPALIGLAIVAIAALLLVALTATVVGDFGFTARRVDERLETEKGLLERRMIGLPVGRVQAVRVEQTALRRPLHMVAVYVDTAGFGRSDENGQGSAPVIPLAHESELPPLLHGLLPELEKRPDPRPLPRRALRRYLFLPLLVTSIPVIAAITFTPWGWTGAVLVVAAGASAALSWKGAGIAADEHLLVMRRGVLGTHEVRIPRTRIQHLVMSQNPFQKRARLATLTAYSVSGSTKAAYSVRHMDAADADALVAWYREGARSAVARAATPSGTTVTAAVPS